MNVEARKGVVIATGGFTSNVAFRMMFDPRLTEEYQVAGEPWSRQNADGEMLAMAVGAALWGTSNVASERGRTVTKTRHIGARYGYENLRWHRNSPMFPLVGGSGLTVRSYQDVICVNQWGRRFWNELDDTYGFLNACLSRHDSSGKSGKLNGGGPIWAIFDADAVTREEWDPTPPNVDPNGWFFSAGTIADLARKIANPYQLEPMPRAHPRGRRRQIQLVRGRRQGSGVRQARPDVQDPEAAVLRGVGDSDPPRRAGGLRTNQRCEVLDIRGGVIPGLYCAGESAGGFALHGLPRVTVFGRIAGREAARVRT